MGVVPIPVNTPTPTKASSSKSSAKRRKTKATPVKGGSYKEARNDQEQALKAEVIKVIKKLLSKKNLPRDKFKFLCFHVSSNIFSRLVNKKDISRPQRMVKQRSGKISKLIDDELARL